jgi:hypothetical protein
MGAGIRYMAGFKVGQFASIGIGAGVDQMIITIPNIRNTKMTNGTYH